MSRSTTKSGMVKGEDVTNKEVRYEVRILFRDKTMKLRYFKQLQDANNELSDIVNESLKKDYGFKFGKEVESESETESSDE